MDAGQPAGAGTCCALRAVVALSFSQPHARMLCGPWCGQGSHVAEAGSGIGSVPVWVGLRDDIGLLLKPEPSSAPARDGSGSG